MTRVTIIGNGFDLHHGLKTSFTDFLDSIDEKIISQNFFLHYFSNRVNKDEFTWINFENEIANILINLERIYDKPKFISEAIVSGKKYIASRYVLDYNDFTTPNDVFFLYCLSEFGFNFFTIVNRSELKIIPGYEINWHFILQEILKEHFEDFEKMFNDYINNINQSILNKEINKTGNREIVSILERSGEIVNFNYTNTPLLYLNEKNSTKIKFIHNKVNDNIIIGINELSNYNSEYNSYFYKTIKYITTGTYKIDTFLEFKGKLKDLNHSDKLNIIFIGHSFGISDHYLFSDLKTLLNDGLDLTITFYSYNIDSKSSFIFNLKQFFGSLKIDELFRMNRIIFKEY